MADTEPKSSPQLEVSSSPRTHEPPECLKAVYFHLLQLLSVKKVTVFNKPRFSQWRSTDHEYEAWCFTLRCHDDAGRRWKWSKKKIS